MDQELKAVFLDIDGVLNNSRSVAVKIGPSSEGLAKRVRIEPLPFVVQYALKTIDPVCVALLNKLFDADPELALVLSSSHRAYLMETGYLFRSSEHLAALRHYLTAMGVNVPRTFSATARLHKERGYEVDDFLCHAYENGIDIDRYIILDDSKDFLPGQPLIWCDPEYGFSYANYVEACKQLGLQEPSVILF